MWPWPHNLKNDVDKAAVVSIMQQMSKLELSSRSIKDLIDKSRLVGVIAKTFMKLKSFS